MRPRLPRRVLARCFFRSLLLQSAWNVRGMQNLGFAYAIWPALAALYPDPEARKAAVARHLEPFNTHPYMAEAILGGAIHHELRIAAGHLPPGHVGRFKRALAGPLAGLGDTFFWAAWRPAIGALGVLLLPLLGVCAVPVFLVVYNLVHLSVRLYLFKQRHRARGRGPRGPGAAAPRGAGGGVQGPGRRRRGAGPGRLGGDLGPCPGLFCCPGHRRRRRRGRDPAGPPPGRGEPVPGGGGRRRGRGPGGDRHMMGAR